MLPLFMSILDIYKEESIARHRLTRITTPFAFYHTAEIIKG